MVSEVRLDTVHEFRLNSFAVLGSPTFVVFNSCLLITLLAL